MDTAVWASYGGSTVTELSAQSAQTANVGGSVLADVSRRIVQLHKEAFGRGPTKARSFISGEVLVCLLEGGFLPMERTLTRHGRGDLVDEQREAIQHVLGDRFVATVEEVMGRQVVSFMSAADQERELCTEIFVLEPAPDGEPLRGLGERREALSHWR